MAKIRKFKILGQQGIEHDSFELHTTFDEQDLQQFLNEELEECIGKTGDLACKIIEIRDSRGLSYN